MERDAEGDNLHHCMIHLPINVDENTSPPNQIVLVQVVGECKMDDCVEESLGHHGEEADSQKGVLDGLRVSALYLEFRELVHLAQLPYGEGLFGDEPPSSELEEFDLQGLEDGLVGDG